MNSNNPDTAPATGKAQKRKAHTVRFFEPELARIEAFAEERGLTSAEFVRFAALAAIGDGDGEPLDRLAPLIRSTYRLTYILATRRRHELIEAGEKESLEDLIRTARASQAELLGGASD